MATFSWRLCGADPSTNQILPNNYYWEWSPGGLVALLWLHSKVAKRIWKMLLVFPVGERKESTAGTLNWIFLSKNTLSICIFYYLFIFQLIALNFHFFINNTLKNLYCLNSKLLLHVSVTDWRVLLLLCRNGIGTTRHDRTQHTHYNRHAATSIK